MIIGVVIGVIAIMAIFILGGFGARMWLRRRRQNYRAFMDDGIEDQREVADRMIEEAIRIANEPITPCTLPESSHQDATPTPSTSNTGPQDAATPSASNTGPQDAATPSASNTGPQDAEGVVTFATPNAAMVNFAPSVFR